MKKRLNRWDDTDTIKRKEFKHGITGLGMAPAEAFHETLISHYIVLNFSRLRRKKFMAIHHARIDDKGLKIPDVSFWLVDKATGYPQTPLVVIEIDDHKGQSTAVKKCQTAIQEHNIKEAFIYVSDTGKWRKFTLNGELKTKLSYSNTIKLDLNKLLPQKS